MAVIAAPKLSRDLQFTRPQITPKAYVTKGPSQWPEAFARKEADRHLAEFLAPLKVDEVVQMFLDRQSTRDLVGGKREPEEWMTVIGFIGRLIGIPHHEVPHIVGIAFWGKTLIAALEGGTGAN